MEKERTLVLIKPDAFAKDYECEILAIYLQAGFKIRALKLMQMTPEIAARHYAEHVGRDYYEELVKFMISGPLIAMVLEGDDVIARVRALNGKTRNPEPGTIRAKYAEDTTRNAVHASDSPESAVREIPIFFDETEIFE